MIVSFTILALHLYFLYFFKLSIYLFLSRFQGSRSRTKYSSSPFNINKFNINKYPVWLI